VNGGRGLRWVVEVVAQTGREVNGETGSSAGFFDFDGHRSRGKAESDPAWVDRPSWNSLRNPRQRAILVGMELKIRVHGLPQGEVEVAEHIGVVVEELATQIRPDLPMAEPLATESPAESTSWHLEPVLDGGLVGAAATFAEDAHRHAVDLVADWRDGQPPDEQQWRLSTAVDPIKRWTWKDDATVYTVTGLNIAFSGLLAAAFWWWTEPDLGVWSILLAGAVGFVSAICFLVGSLWALEGARPKKAGSGKRLAARRRSWSVRVRKVVKASKSVEIL